MKTIDYWYQVMISKGSPSISKVSSSLEREYPKIISLIMERNCNLNCRHCFFQKETSSHFVSKENCLEEKILNIVSQLPKNSSVVHEGRILSGWHIPLLERIRETRPDIKIGLLDNGSYLKHEKVLKESNFMFDWIDISLDGMRETHNFQRGSSNSFTEAIEGIKRAREFSRKVTSLFTVTKINLLDISKTVEFLTTNKLVDEIHITPASEVEIKDNNFVLSAEDYHLFWKQYKESCRIAKINKSKVFLRFYDLENLRNLIKVTGKNSFDKSSILVDTYSVSFLIDGVRVTCVPKSICVAETFVIDADATYRLPYCMQYTLDEHRSGFGKNGKIADFNVSKLENDSNFRELYSLGATKWFGLYGKKELKKEFFFFNSLFNF